jgi:hypothetical protein
MASIMDGSSRSNSTPGCAKKSSILSPRKDMSLVRVPGAGASGTVPRRPKALDLLPERVGVVEGIAPDCSVTKG